MEQITLSATMQHTLDKHVIRPSQHDMEGKSCLNDFIFFCDKTIHIIDEGKAVDIST